MKHPTPTDNRAWWREMLEKARRDEMQRLRESMVKKHEILELIEHADPEGPHLPEPIPRGYDDPLFQSDPLVFDDPIFKRILAKDPKRAEWVERVRLARQVKAVREMLEVIDEVLKLKERDLTPHR
ncbi:hypothetical protein SAMN05877809_103248 [Rhodobacter sp. JA431]|uniref:hypothetical protein n=1 Tax=Rhodobacter sp. JA431 TaxID=570013 RepID=UPI000BD8B19A|nr:hypothetical protein [Rhodobacter sp. JA431]SOC04662.1 hypothetical protein SAMN05877809_103248 [Rhodobacter sp. JA431]